jgi:hypothetical protein
VDQNLLVSSGHALLDLLEKKGVKSRAAMWVHNTDSDSWKLWIVPDKNVKDKLEFYRKVAEAISENRDDVPGIDASDTEMVADTHPAITSLSKFISAPGKHSIHLSNNKLKDFYLADGIVLRLSL